MATGLGKRLLNRLSGGRSASAVESVPAQAVPATPTGAQARSSAAPGKGGTVVSVAPGRAAAAKVPAAKVPAAKVPPAKVPAAPRPAKAQPADRAKSETGPGLVRKPVPVAKAPAKTAPARKASPAKAPVAKASAVKAPAKKAVAVKTPAKKAPIASPSAQPAPTPEPTPTPTPTRASKAAARPAKVLPAVIPSGPLTGADAWSADELIAIRAELDVQAQELRDEIAAAEVVSDSLKRDASSEGSGDEADAGTKTFEREHEMSLANNSRDLLLQVERAQGHLNAGTYGRCEDCGLPIPKARLQAFPRSTLCVSCKQREERR